MTMTIIHVSLEIFRGEAVGKVFLFEDDTSVSVDVNTNEVYDMDGMHTVSDSKHKTLEVFAGHEVIR